MEKLEEELWKTLQKLEEEEFKNFKWFLSLDGITKAQLEKAGREKTVDLMVQKYGDLEARKKANKILKKIDMNNLVKHSENSSSGQRCRQEQGVLPDPSESGSRSSTMVLWFTVIFASTLAGICAIWAARNGGQEISTYGKTLESLSAIHGSDLKIIRPSAQMERSRQLVKLEWAQQFAEEVTLDPDTAHPHLILSDDGKQVYHGDVRQKLPDSPGRFKRFVSVLGKQSFSSGKFYFEVQVGGKNAWTVGVASESIDRTGDIPLSPENGLWTLWLRKGDDFFANDVKPVQLALHPHPKKLGVFVDYEEGLVSFYDVDAADILYSFTGCSFTEKLYPFFSPCINEGGTNSAPLIITPVNHPVNLQTRDSADHRIKEDNERKQAELMSVQ